LGEKRVGFLRGKANGQDHDIWKEFGEMPASLAGGSDTVHLIAGGDERTPQGVSRFRIRIDDEDFHVPTRLEILQL
jgi:hypothetical protein